MFLNEPPAFELQEQFLRSLLASDSIHDIASNPYGLLAPQCSPRRCDRPAPRRLDALDLEGEPDEDGRYERRGGDCSACLSSLRF